MPTVREVVEMPKKKKEVTSHPDYKGVKIWENVAFNETIDLIGSLELDEEKLRAKGWVKVLRDMEIRAKLMDLQIELSPYKIALISNAIRELMEKGKER